MEYLILAHLILTGYLLFFCTRENKRTQKDIDFILDHVDNNLENIIELDKALTKVYDEKNKF